MRKLHFSKLIGWLLVGMVVGQCAYAQPPGGKMPDDMMEEDAKSRSLSDEGLTTCRGTLEVTQTMYGNGDVVGIPNLLYGCLQQKGAFTKEEKVRAQKLITLAYIFNDDVVQSEQSLEALLRTDPVYELDPVADPKELFYLYHKFRTDPIFRIRVYAGGNYTMFNQVSRYGVENIGTAAEEAQSGIRGYAGASFDKEFFDQLELSVGLQLEFREYSLTNQLYDYSSYQLSETQLSVSAPLYARYLFGTARRVHPYLTIGWVPNFVFASNLTGSREGNTVVNIESQNLLKEGIRNPFTHAAIGGLGLRFLSRNKKGFLFLEALYYHGLTTPTNANNRFNTSQDISFRLGYIDDTFTLNGAQLSVGYIISLYKPKKLRRFRKLDGDLDE